MSKLIESRVLHSTTDRRPWPSQSSDVRPSTSMSGTCASRARRTGASCQMQFVFGPVWIHRDMCVLIAVARACGSSS